MSENYLIIYIEAMQQSPAVLSFGGMCFVRRWFEEMFGKDKVGPSGPFDYTATTPEIVRHILTDDFSEFLRISHFYACRGQYNEPNVRHKFYEQMALSEEMAAMAAKFMHPGKVMPPMFMHPGKNGVEGLIDDLARRAQRVREFLRAHPWKLMVWGVALPYPVYTLASSCGIDPVEILKEQVLRLFKVLQSRTEHFALAVICIIEGVPANGKIVSFTEVLSDYNDQQKVCVMHFAAFHSSRVGMRFEDKDSSAGTAGYEQNKVKIWLLNVLHQEGWQQYALDSSKNQMYYANESLKLHQWNAPLAFLLGKPSCPTRCTPRLIQVDSSDSRDLELERMLLDRPFDFNLMSLADDYGKSTSTSFSWIIADSTIMEHSCRHHWVKHDQELLGIAVGGYGLGFFSGVLEHLKECIKDGYGFPFASPSRSKELVVAYVPAEGFKQLPYNEHSARQKENLDCICIRTPTIDAFARVYQRLFGENMIRKKGVHLTNYGRLWFAWALQIWARVNGAQVVLCIGWNAGQCRKNEISQQISEEYSRQKSLVQDLHDWHRRTCRIED